MNGCRSPIEARAGWPSEVDLRPRASVGRRTVAQWAWKGSPHKRHYGRCGIEQYQWHSVVWPDYDNAASHRTQHLVGIVFQYRGRHRLGVVSWLAVPHLGNTLQRLLD